MFQTQKEGSIYHQQRPLLCTPFRCMDLSSYDCSQLSVFVVYTQNQLSIVVKSRRTKHLSTYMMINAARPFSSEARVVNNNNNSNKRDTFQSTCMKPKAQGQTRSGCKMRKQAIHKRGREPRMCLSSAQKAIQQRHAERRCLIFSFLYYPLSPRGIGSLRVWFIPPFLLRFFFLWYGCIWYAGLFMQ